LDPFELAISPDVTLRLTTPDDIPAFFEFVERNRASLERWLGWAERARDINGAREFVERYYKRWEHRAALLANIWCEGQVAGIAVYRTIDALNNRVEIGYALDEAFRGRGLATAVTRGLTDYAFDVLGMHRAVINCASGNLPSRAIPERLGYRHEGTSREATFVRGTYVDLEHYAILSYEWQAMRAAAASDVAVDGP
jgi:ribosomal-protein-serine acetyltransferase